MKSKLNILLISTACAPTVTDGSATYGGIERVLGDFAAILVKRGHEVTVAAPFGSILPEGVNHFPTVRLPQEVWMEDVIFQKLSMNNMIPDGFDILHDFSHEHKCSRISHGCWAVNHPFLHMIWHPPYFHGMPNRIPEPAYNLCGIAKHHAYGLKKVYNQDFKYGYLGVNTERYAYEENKSDRYLWISVANQEKGGIEAIQICRELGLKLDCLPASLQNVTPYMMQMKSLCDGNQIRWIEQLPERENVKYYQGAKGLIAPISQAEPFGLIISESLSCGTPVFAFNNGAIPEQMVDGETSFGVVANTVDELKLGLKAYEAGKDYEYDLAHCFDYDSELTVKTESTKHLRAEFSPRKCRERVVSMFSREIMVDRYLELYREIIERCFWY